LRFVETQIAVPRLRRAIGANIHEDQCPGWDFFIAASCSGLAVA
jgi:hypothetical protein